MAFTREENLQRSEERRREWSARVKAGAPPTWVPDPNHAYVPKTERGLVAESVKSGCLYVVVPPRGCRCGAKSWSGRCADCSAMAVNP